MLQDTCSAAATPASSSADDGAISVIAITDSLGYEAWREIRDARETAQRTKTPLRFDLTRCASVTTGGLGSLLLVHERTGELRVSGCPDSLAKVFDGVGLCKRCANRDKCAQRRASLRDGRKAKASVRTA